MRSYIGIPMAVGKGNGKGNGDGDGNGEILLHCFQPPLPPHNPVKLQKIVSGFGRSVCSLPNPKSPAEQKKKTEPGRGGGGEGKENRKKKTPTFCFVSTRNPSKFAVWTSRIPLRNGAETFPRPIPSAVRPPEGAFGISFKIKEISCVKRAR